MDINISTPALLFPAISLIMLAYTNRFLALSNRVRSLHDQYQTQTDKKSIHLQIKNLKYRLKLIKNMQALGIASFMACLLSMYCIYMYSLDCASVLFGISVLLFISSLLLSFWEIQISTRALEIQLSDLS